MPLVSKSVQPHCTPDFPALWRSSIFNWFHWLVKDTRTLYIVGMDTYRRYSIGPINIRNKRFLVNFQLKTCDVNKLKPIFCLYSFTFDFLQLNWAARCLLFDPLQKKSHFHVFSSTCPQYGACANNLCLRAGRRGRVVVIPHSNKRSCSRAILCV